MFGFHKSSVDCDMYTVCRMQSKLRMDVFTLNENPTNTAQQWRNGNIVVKHVKHNKKNSYKF